MKKGIEHSKKLLVPLTAVLLLLVSWIPAAAQATKASLGGTVQDVSGASAPGAEVAVRNVQTGLTVTASAATDGSFLFPSLPVRTYRPTAVKARFTTYMQRGIILAVDPAPYHALTLKVGAKLR